MNVLSYFSSLEILLLSLAAVTFTLSIGFFYFEKKKTALAILFCGVVGLGFFVANLDPYLNLWDEQFHALVAKNMIKNPLKPMLFSEPILEYNYKNWWSNAIWLHKQPLFLWQIALSLKLFGTNVIALRLPSILMHGVATIFVYRIGKIIQNEKTGFYGALFFGASHAILALTSGVKSTDHNDVAFLFYITASLWAWFENQNSKKWHWLLLIGLFSGCAILVKWLVGLLVYAVWGIVIISENIRQLLNFKLYLPMLYSLLVTILVFVPWQLYILVQFPKETQYEFHYNTLHFFKPIEGHGGDFWFHFDALNELYGRGDLVISLILLGFALLIWKIRTKSYRIAVFTAVVVVYTFFTMANTKMISFCIIVAPFVFLSFGVIVQIVLSYLRKKISSNWLNFILTTSVLVLLSYAILNLPKIAKNHSYKKETAVWRRLNLNQMELIQVLKTSLNKEHQYVIFNSSIRFHGNISVMFFTNYTAYSKIPTISEIKQVQQQNYDVVVIDKGNLPDYIINNPSITILPFTQQ